jgi:hypothetical protein
MMNEYWPIILQTIVIVVAIAASFVRTRERITRVETKVEHLEGQVAPIPGMSRAIARLEGQTRLLKKGAD